MWLVYYDEVMYMYNNEEQGLFRSKLETVSSSREYIPPVQNVSPGCSIRTSLMLFTGQCQCCREITFILNRLYRDISRYIAI